MSTQEQILAIAGLLAVRQIGAEERAKHAGSSGEEWRLALQLVERLDELPLGTAAEIPATDGYAEWADSYDDPHNPFFSLQERYLFPQLNRESVQGVVLDVAGGTGRLGSRFVGSNTTVLVLDRSSAMLGQARNKAAGLLLAQADFEHLPVAGRSVDHLFCSLALTHTRALRQVISEFARVTTKPGTIHICDIHPTAVMLGWQAFFDQKTGDRAFVRNYVHTFSAYMNAFKSCGLAVATISEIPFDEESLQLVTEDALTRASIVRAFVGWPALVVWTLHHLESSSCREDEAPSSAEDDWPAELGVSVFSEGAR